MLKQRKEEIVSALTEEFGGVTQMIVADPTGLSVAEMKELRNRLRPQRRGVPRGQEHARAHRRAARRVVRNWSPCSSGRRRITLVPGDPAAAAKTLSDFGRTSRKLELRGAYLDGVALDADGVKQLATLPSREQLLANLVTGMISPLSGFANVLAQLPRSLVVALDQVRQQKEAAA